MSTRLEHFISIISVIGFCNISNAAKYALHYHNKLGRHHMKEHLGSISCTKQFQSEY